MVMSQLTVKGIVPDLAILGNFQRLSFTEKDASFQLKNLFSANTQAIASTSLEFVDHALHGFRFLHTIPQPETEGGTLTLEAFNALSVIQPIFTVHPDLSVVFSTPVHTQALTAKTLHVTGNATIDGDLHVGGTVYAKRASGFLYLPRATPVPLTTTAAKIPLTTTVGLLQGFTTGGVSNRLVVPQEGPYAITLTMGRTSPSAVYMTAYLYKNGELLPGSESFFTKPAGTSTARFAITYHAALKANDYIEVWAASSVAETVNIENFQLSISAV